MQRRLGDQRVVIVRPKHPRSLQRRDHARDGLQLCSGLGDRLLVDHKCLDKELVREFFEAAVVGDLRSEEEEAETSLGSFDLVVQQGDDLVDEFEYRGEALLPVFHLRRQ